ncbi:unknown [Bacteroides eggerthii CAG:109]|nr:unknown [Bacteroides eggerthii CAG:109]
MQKFFLQLRFFLFHEVFHLFLQTGIFFDILADCTGQVGSIVEECFQIAHCILECIKHFFYAGSGIGFDTADTGGNGTFGYNFHHPDVSGSGYVCATAEFNGGTELDNTYVVTIFLAEQRNSSQFFSFFNGYIAIFFQRNIGAYLGIYNVFYLTNLLICYFLEMREVETQRVRIH